MWVAFSFHLVDIQWSVLDCVGNEKVVLHVFHYFFCLKQFWAIDAKKTRLSSQHNPDMAFQLMHANLWPSSASSTGGDIKPFFYSFFN